MHTVYDSRAFQVDDSIMLVPFAELANHDGLGSSGVNIRCRGRKFSDHNASTEAENEP